jgi:hypothetical protein
MVPPEPPPPASVALATGLSELVHAQAAIPRSMDGTKIFMGALVSEQRERIEHPLLYLVSAGILVAASILSRESVASARGDACSVSRARRNDHVFETPLSSKL